MDFVSARVITHDVERLATFWEQVTGLPVTRPTDMPWGNRSLMLRDPDGGLVNLFTPVTPEAKAKYGL